MLLLRSLPLYKPEMKKACLKKKEKAKSSSGDEDENE